MCGTIDQELAERSTQLNSGLLKNGSRMAKRDTVK